MVVPSMGIWGTHRRKTGGLSIVGTVFEIHEI